VIKRQTLTSQVIDHILDLIKSGQVKPGEKLPTEKQLTETLGVSRTCIREAMKSLESLRLISIRPKVGTVVLTPTPSALFSGRSLSTLAHLQETDILIEFRSVIEVGLAVLATKKATEQDLSAMRKALEEHKRALASDGIAYPADIAFHKAIAEASRNPIAIAVLQLISEPLTEQRRRTNRVRQAAEDGLRDHRRIFRAIQRRDSDKVRKAMIAHMRTAAHYWHLARAQDGLQPRVTPQQSLTA
jgi:GntR family transcriptional repressor for pyruvate dehydrogenase complex